MRVPLVIVGYDPTHDYTLTSKPQLLEPFDAFDGIRYCSGAGIAYLVTWFSHIRKGVGGGKRGGPERWQV